MLRELVILLFIPFLFATPNVLAAGCTPVPPGDLEPHGPITIGPGTDLSLPDVVVNHGVRGGSGTAEDPYRITDWQLERGADLWIWGRPESFLLERLSLHDASVRLEDVGSVAARNLHVDEGSWQATSVPHVEADQIHLDRGLSAFRSGSVSFSNTTLAGGSISLVEVDDASLVDLIGCSLSGAPAVRIESGGAILIRDAELAVTGSVHLWGNAVVTNVSFEGLGDRDALQVADGSGSSLLLSEARFTSWEYGIRAPQGADEDVAVTIRNSTFDGGTSGRAAFTVDYVSDETRDTQVSLRVESSRVRGYSVGLLVGTQQTTGDWSDAMEQAPAGYEPVIMRDTDLAGVRIGVVNTFEDAGVDARYNHWGDIEDVRFVGNVQWEPYWTDAAMTKTADSPLGVVGWLLILSILVVCCVRPRAIRP